MTEPRTEAGRELGKFMPRLTELRYGKSGESIILAIEAEATRAERERIEEAVQECLIPNPVATRYGHGYTDALRTVLRLLDPLPSKGETE